MSVTKVNAKVTDDQRCENGECPTCGSTYHAADRDDYLAEVRSLDNLSVYVSSGELFVGVHANGATQACLLQVENEISGNFTCAYLSDNQVLQLIRSLADYLSKKATA